jgi:hypothetical protein
VRKKDRKPHIKQKQFADRNYSSLESHTRRKGGLDSPFKKITGATFSSWYSTYLPNVLWACVLSSLLDRELYLSLFRQTVMAARELEEGSRPRVIAHSFLGEVSDEIFDRIFGAVLSTPTAREVLRSLCLIEALPDRRHWLRNLGEPNQETDWSPLVHAVADNFDHQSQRATDVRWMKVMHEIISGQTRFSEQMADLLENFRLYPNRGEMSRVRPHIRAMEMGLRNIEAGLLGEEAPSMMGEAFWVEMKQKTSCIHPREFEPPTLPSAALRDEAMSVMERLQNHFDETVVTTNVDARHDGAFGLTLFSMSYLVSLSAFYGHDFPFSRTVLRSIVESFITLEYLAKKDDPSIWEQYRRYGAGQAKLVFLKNIREEEVPEFFDLRLMEALANEDMWMEFEDVEIGNWAKTDLRSMAIFAGVKREYDLYYDWASGFAHGHWMAVRETAFVNCLNPLHRYHRIPGPPLSPLPSVLPDAAKLVNRMLDRLNHLYPTFTPRLSAHRTQK